MTRKHLLIVGSMVALAVGSIALFAPYWLLGEVKGVAEPTSAAAAMARTVGILLLAFGVLNWKLRALEEPAAVQGLLLANLVLQLGLLPLDPYAYAVGAFVGVGSFVPNSLLHIGLSLGFAAHLVRANRRS